MATVDNPGLLSNTNTTIGLRVRQPKTKQREASLEETDTSKKERVGNIRGKIMSMLRPLRGVLNNKALKSVIVLIIIFFLLKITIFR